MVLRNTPRLDVPASPVHARRYEAAGVAMAGAVVALGALALAGWALGMKHGLGAGGRALMKPNAGLCFVVLGLSLLLGRGGGRARTLSLGLAAAGAALSLATLAEWTFGVDLHIDELLFRDDTGAYTLVPGRVAPNTALAFALMGVALLLPRRGGGTLRLRCGLAAACVAIGAIGVAGYLYGASRLYAVAQRTDMAPSAAVGLAVLGCAMLVARPERGPVALLASDGPGGALARWLIPLVAFAPLLLAWPAQAGVRAGHLDQAYASALVTVGLTGVLVGVVFVTARAIDARDAVRREREREVARLSVELELRREQLRAEQELQITRSELARARRLEEAGMVASQVAHDLRNLVQPLLLGVELVQRRIGPHHAAREASDRLSSGLRRLSDVIEDSLTLGRRAQLRLEPTDLNRVLLDAIEGLREPPESLTVRVELAPELPYVTGAPRQLIRAFTNLLANAREAMNDRGILTVRSGPVELARGDGAVRGRFARVEISDTGCGIAPEHLAHLFQPFFTTKAGGPRSGSGLGLAIVQAIVSDHQGTVSVASQLGQGTSFTITVPAADAESSPAAPA